MIRRPPRSTLDRSSAASDVYKRQVPRSLKPSLAGAMPAAGAGRSCSVAMVCAEAMVCVGVTDCVGLAVCVEDVVLQAVSSIVVNTMMFFMMKSSEFGVESTRRASVPSK